MYDASPRGKMKNAYELAVLINTAKYWRNNKAAQLQ
jgi:hypothetical protein